MKLSIILLDWSVREYFQALHFLQKQSVPRDQYELIWVELYDYKAVPEIVEKTADQLICCRQKGVYEKHKGYNAGLLAAKGELVCICDSDAVFPFDFVEKILHYFYGPQLDNEPGQKILQIYERRCAQSEYPGLDQIDLNTIEQDYFWQTWENVCACGVFRKKDMISFGGLDEHHTYRGFFCGYNELVNRLVNAGWEEYWMPDDQLAIWHFKHLRPVDTSYGTALLDTLKEFAADEIESLSILSVEAAASGRIYPLKENKQVHALRLVQRKFGSAYEEKYTNPVIYRREAFKYFMRGWCSKGRVLIAFFRYIKHFLCTAIIGKKNYEALKTFLLRRPAENSPLCGIILAGGLGTRLQSVVSDRQKVAAEVGGEPFICKILQQLQTNGVTQVILCVGHKAETVEKALCGKFPDMQIIFSRENVPLGTAGAIRQALDRTNAEGVLILNGDSYFDVDLHNFIQAWHKTETPIGILLKEMEDVSRYGKVTLDNDGVIRAFEEKGAYSGKGWINAGIYTAKREYLLKTLKKGKGSLEKEYFPVMAEQRLLSGFIQNGHFIDIGTPESFKQAQYFFKEKK